MRGKPRGNPNWIRPQFKFEGVRVTQFEKLCQRLNLNSDDEILKTAQNESIPLMAWLKRNADRYYVPLWLLEALGIKQEPEWMPMSYNRVAIEVV